ncbi:PREDICTED: zinc finger protein Elbow [Dufourea novaeangliae]|uniref:zinc finger protein Elbow n=1 Tax=Dufourea novaeangliae TaxID=178035 RepID=UPI0007675C54|nr:PREDICTED: zinc finger protein Elbow [Dufourea novaeangliae]
MLTSSANQYLRPEYLTPLPTTLDAKKSPLALLAQTCSQIGADTPSNKSLLGSLDKPSSNKSSKSADQSREKSSPAVALTSTESSKTNFKPYESCLGREKASSPDEQRSASSHSTSGRSRTPGSGNKRCPSNQSASSVRAVTPQGRKTATPNGDVARESPASRTSTANLSLVQHESSSSSQPAVVSSPSLQAKPSYSPAGVLAMTDPSIKDLPLGTFKPGVSLASSTAAYLGYSPQLPVDVMASSLMSQHHAALKNGLVAGNPYLSYARLKSASGAEALMPVCRDPYCTGCQLNSHLFASSASAAVANGKLASSAANGAGTCPAGCVQCDHKSGTPYGALGVAAYAHAQLAALAAASQLPYVCNWIAGDTAYCGKRFSTSDELLQHLRSHTSVSSSGATDPSAATLSLLSPSVGLPPTHPLFSRTYPTPPLSPLATARYHPYGKPSPLLPPSLSSLGLPLPPPHPHTPAGLPPYFSPYSLYGAPRLGAASGMPQ